VPTVIGHYLLEGLFYLHTVVVLDIANGARPVEVSRVKLDDNYFPHWTGWDARTNRVVVTPGRTGDSRLYLLKFDPSTGAISLDEAFHDSDGKPGFNFTDRDWPHGWKGSGQPHGVVFSR
jgi:hypothetical protein